MKVKPKDLSKEQTIQTLDALYTAAGSLKGRAAMKQFLRDLLTPSERIMLGRRIVIAKHLLSGKTYQDIQVELKVGSDTVWKVHRWLLDSMPGYEDALKGMQQEFDKRKQRAKIGSAPFSFKAIKRKYPLHFLLFNLGSSHSRTTKKTPD